MNNSIINEKYTRKEGMKSRLGDTEEYISDLEDKRIYITQSTAIGKVF